MSEKRYESEQSKIEGRLFLQQLKAVFIGGQTLGRFLWASAIKLSGKNPTQFVADTFMADIGSAKLGEIFKLLGFFFRQ